MSCCRFDYGGSFSSYSTSYGEEAESGLNETVNAALREMSIDDGFDQSSTRGPTSPTSGLRGHMPSLRRPSPSISRKNKSNSSAPTTNFNEDQDRIVNLSHLPIRQSHIDSFRPIVAFSLPSHSQSCLAMSDIGFLASSSGAALAIIDMRGPEILYFDPGESSGFLGGNSKGKGKVGRSDGSHITSLTWTISAIGEGAYHSSILCTSLPDSSPLGTHRRSRSQSSTYRGTCFWRYTSFRALSHRYRLASFRKSNLLFSRRRCQRFQNLRLR